MKKQFQKMILAIAIIISCCLKETTAQTWNLSGNSDATSTSTIGTINNVALSLSTKGAKRIYIDTLGRVSINTTTPVGRLTLKANGSTPVAAWTTGSTSPIYTSFSESTSGTSDNIYAMATNIATAKPQFIYRRSRGTLAIPLTLANGDNISSLIAGGYDGSAFQNSSSIDFVVDGAPLLTSLPASISFSTGTSTATRTERLKIGSNGNISFNSNQLTINKSNGNVGIGTTTPTAKLEINGQIKITGGIPPTAGSVLTSDATGLAYWGPSSGGSQWTVSGNNIYNSNSGNLGVGTTNPSRAKLEVNGVAGNGSTSAIFGGEGTGISIQRNWPTIGFNQYRDVATGNGKAIGNGFGMQMNMDPSTGAFSINMQDSVAANASFVNTPVRGISVFKNGFVHVGNNNISDQASLSISGSSSFPSHFNYGSTGNTYIRGGSKTHGGVGIYANRRPSKVYINDLQGEEFFTGAAKPGGDVILVAGGGKVGVGVDNPASPLSFPNVLGNKISFWNASASADYGIGIASGTMQFYTAGQDQFGFGYGNSANFTQTMTYYPGSAQLGINCLPQAGYQLAVNGSVRAKEIRVETGWADYVFADDYKLRSLKEVEDFIKTNKHLPDVTAGNEIETNGLEVGKTSAQMIRKIEELTLYMIEQDKALKALQMQNTRLESAIISLTQKGGK